MPLSPNQAAAAAEASHALHAIAEVASWRRLCRRLVKHLVRFEKLVGGDLAAVPVSAGVLFVGLSGPVGLIQPERWLVLRHGRAQSDLAAFLWRYGPGEALTTEPETVKRLEMLGVLVEVREILAAQDREAR